MSQQKIFAEFVVVLIELGLLGLVAFRFCGPRDEHLSPEFG